jgi:hypothetical protein
MTTIFDKQTSRLYELAAYNDGVRAFYHGTPLAANPYTDELAARWEAGWLDAQEGKA